MAKFNLYKCEKCGYSFGAPYKGYDRIRMGWLLTYQCNKCKVVDHIFVDEFDPTSRFGVRDDRGFKAFVRFKIALESCEHCQNRIIHPWTGYSCKCPKCKGKLIEERVQMMVD